MNKYKQKLISFAAAAAMLISALPVQVGAVNNTTDAANYYYAIDENSTWVPSDGVKVEKAETAVTITSETAEGFAYLELPDEVPNSGSINVNFTFTFDVESKKTTISLLPEIPTIDTSKDASIRENDYFLIFKEDVYKRQVVYSSSSIISSAVP